MLYSIVKAILVLLFKYLCRWEIEGTENIPKEGPVIIAANHVSYWDPVALGVAIPDRRIYFMAKANLFKIPVLAQIITNFGAFPVDRNKSDREALRAGIEVVSNGNILGIFPEGTRVRDGSLGKFLGGAAMIAAKANVPIIPAALVNTPNIFSRGFFRPFRVVFKEPIYITKEEGQKKVTSQQLEEVSSDIRQQILAVLQDSKDFYRKINSKDFYQKINED